MGVKCTSQISADIVSLPPTTWPLHQDHLFSVFATAAAPIPGPIFVMFSICKVTLQEKQPWYLSGLEQSMIFASCYMSISGQRGGPSLHCPPSWAHVVRVSTGWNISICCGRWEGTLKTVSLPQNGTFHLCSYFSSHPELQVGREVKSSPAPEGGDTEILVNNTSDSLYTHSVKI